MKYPTHISFTTSLANYIKSMQDKVNEGKLPAVLHDKNLQAIVETIMDYQAQLKQIPAGVKRALAVLRGIDKLIVQQRSEHRDIHRRVTCRKGCSACCHQMVEITTDEAELLAKLVETGRAAIDPEKLLKQASWSTDPDKWWLQPKEERSCVFLKDNVCSVYKYRPVNCRKYLVVNDPKECANPLGGPVLTVMMNEVEILATAAGDLDRASLGSNMPQTLLKAIMKRGMLRGKK